MVTFAESVRNSVRNEITKYQSTASLYSYADATVTTNDEGEDTEITWGSAASIGVISSNHMSFKRMLEKMGIETDNSERGFLLKDNVTIAAWDKVVIGSEAYEVTEIKKIDPIQNTNCVFKITVAKNEVYD